MYWICLKESKRAQKAAQRKQREKCVTQKNLSCFFNCSSCSRNFNFLLFCRRETQQHTTTLSDLWDLFAWGWMCSSKCEKLQNLLLVLHSLGYAFSMCILYLLQVMCDFHRSHLHHSASNGGSVDRLQNERIFFNDSFSSMNNEDYKFLYTRQSQLRLMLCGSSNCHPPSLCSSSSFHDCNRYERRRKLNFTIWAFLQLTLYCRMHT